MGKATTLGSMHTTIEVVARTLAPPVPGSAEPVHDYTVLFTTRAETKSRIGTNTFAQVVVGNRIATHSFQIRWTSIAFDTRNRVRDVTGKLWAILSIENVDLGRQWMRLHCAEVGHDDAEAAR